MFLLDHWNVKIPPSWSAIKTFDAIFLSKFRECAFFRHQLSSKTRIFWQFHKKSTPYLFLTLYSVNLKQSIIGSRNPSWALYRSSRTRFNGIVCINYYVFFSCHFNPFYLKTTKTNYLHLMLESFQSYCDTLIVYLVSLILCNFGQLKNSVITLVFEKSHILRSSTFKQLTSTEK